MNMRTIYKQHRRLPLIRAFFIGNRPQRLVKPRFDKIIHSYLLHIIHIC